MTRSCSPMINLHPSSLHSEKERKKGVKQNRFLWNGDVYWHAKCNWEALACRPSLLCDVTERRIRVWIPITWDFKRPWGTYFPNVLLVSQRSALVISRSPLVQVVIVEHIRDWPYVCEEQDWKRGWVTRLWDSLKLYTDDHLDSL
jgi:hypothetical protein